MLGRLPEVGDGKDTVRAFDSLLQRSRIVEIGADNFHALLRDVMGLSTRIYSMSELPRERRGRYRFVTRQMQVCFQWLSKRSTSHIHCNAGNGLGLRHYFRTECAFSEARL